MFGHIKLFAFLIYITSLCGSTNVVRLNCLNVTNSKMNYPDNYTIVAKHV